jgi:hypothetical protein
MNNLWIASILAVGAFVFGYRTGHNSVQVAFDRYKITQGKALDAAKDEAAANLKAAQDRANAAETQVIDNAKQTASTDADLRRRIEWLRAHPATCPTVPSGSDPTGPTGPTSPTPDLSVTLAEIATDCARDYRDVAGKLEAVGRLTR